VGGRLSHPADAVWIVHPVELMTDRQVRSRGTVG
jgi:hypothetical protein